MHPQASRRPSALLLGPVSRSALSFPSSILQDPWSGGPFPRRALLLPRWQTYSSLYTDNRLQSLLTQGCPSAKCAERKHLGIGLRPARFECPLGTRRALRFADCLLDLREAGMNGYVCRMPPGTQST